MSRDQSYEDIVSRQATIRASQNSQVVEAKANTTLQSMLRDFSKSKAKRAFEELDDRMCGSAKTGLGFAKRGLGGSHSEQRVGSDSATYSKKEAEDAFNALDKAMHKRAKRISNEHAGIIQSKLREYDDRLGSAAAVTKLTASEVVEGKANTTFKSVFHNLSKSKAERAFKELDDRMYGSAETGRGFTKRGLVGSHSEQRVGSDSATYSKKEAEDAFNALDKAMHKRAKRIANKHVEIMQSKLREYDDRLGGAAEVTKLPAKQAWRKKVCKHDDGLDGAGLSGRF
ncbi:MAG: hypothetical protein HOH73_02285 [Alphaproteobacteria bacterium]|jgi:hypothetical protein|nr:hypothetical protein [Alphaproteobacteria bacterium]